MARWIESLKRWAKGDALTPVPSAARTANGNTAALDASAYPAISLFLNVTAVSGTTPNLVVTVEESDDGTTWRAVGSFAAKTAVSSERKSFSIAGDFYRLTWTITGTTPSFTFAVTGTTK